MHITPPRVLGFLMFLALIGYAFFLGPRITAASTHSPATSVTAPKATPSGTPGTQGAPSTSSKASLLPRAE